MHFIPLTADDVYGRKKPKDGQKVTYNGLPILTGSFTNESTFIGSGYDKTPILFKRAANGTWAFVKMLDAGVTQKKDTKIGNNAFGAK
jgi:hypothetical protein